MAIVEVRHIPVGTPTPSYGSFIAATHQVLHQMPGVRHQVTPTSTILEGNLDQCLAAAQQMHQLAFQQGAARVTTNIMIDERIDKPTSGAQMVAEVEQPGQQGQFRQQPGQPGQRTQQLQGTYIP